MNTFSLCLGTFSLLLAVSGFAADSGTLWIQTGFGPQTLMASNVNGADFSITVTSAPDTGGYRAVDVHTYGPGGHLIQKDRFGSSGATSQTFSVRNAGEGLYKIVLRGRDGERGYYRINTSLPKLVLGGWTQFGVWVWQKRFAEGDYFFYIPPEVSSFFFYSHHNIPNAWAHFKIYDSGGRLFLDTYSPKEDGVDFIEVPARESGRYWRVNVYHWSRTRFKCIGIPDWFSSSKSSWFNPDEIITCRRRPE